MLPAVVRHAMRRGLAGIWFKSEEGKRLPASPVVAVANHHSWWDLYLAWWFAQTTGRPLAGLMNPQRLEAFPFFEQHGAIPADKPQRFVRRVRAGDVGLVFPEAAVQPAGAVTLTPEQQRRTGRLVELSRATAVPVAMRVLMRGAEHPEAYVWLGAPCKDVAAAVDRLNGMLKHIDENHAETDPETALPGFSLALQGRRPAHEAAGRWSGWWR